MVLNKDLDFNLRSQFLNLILNSFVNVFRSRSIHSNNYYDISKKDNCIGDEFWEIQYKTSEDQIKKIYPIMIEKSQDIGDIYNNISFEIQKQRFFNSMLNYNLFFELQYDPEEWIYKVFDHCMKMILLCLAHNTAESHSKMRNRTFEVNENYQLDYPSQKSVFHLHFWFKKTIAKGYNSSALDHFDPTLSINDEGGKKNVFVKPVMMKIIEEALKTLHYLVEIRHKFLCGKISDHLHDKMYTTLNLPKHSDTLLDADNLIKYTNETSELVLSKLFEECKLQNSTIPSVVDMFEKFKVSNEKSILRNIQSDSKHTQNLHTFETPSKLENVLMRLLNIETTDINVQQSCITLVGKIKSDSALRLRKLQKAYFEPGEGHYRSAKLMAGLTNVTAFDHRCLAGITYVFESSDHLGIPELISNDYKSEWSNRDVVTCVLNDQGFGYMLYYLDNVYEHLLKRYKGLKHKNIDPNAQDMARTLKIYDNLMWIVFRYNQYLNIINMKAMGTISGPYHFAEHQEPFFTKVFSCLKAITYKNEQMQKVLWKFKEYFV